MDEVQVIITGDGSQSLLNVALDETYHSRHGALQESLYVFIKHGLEHVIEKNTNRKQLNVFEVGFGTGLNAWLTHRLAKSAKLNVHYTSIETFPLPESIWKTLQYTPESERNDFFKLHEATWNDDVVIDSHFILKKQHQRLQDFSTQQTADIIFFDAFAPNKQPELWELPILEKVCNMLVSQGVFVTYCAKGQLKRDLKSLGLVVESLPGPPGKREMLRATKM